MPEVRRGSTAGTTEVQNFPNAPHQSKEENNFTLVNVGQGENKLLCGKDKIAVPTTAEDMIEETLIDDDCGEKVPLAAEKEGRRFSALSLRSAYSRRMEYVRSGNNRFVWNFRTFFLLVFIILIFIIIFFNIYRFFSLL